MRRTKIELTPQDFGTLCICALRYCMGRQTYMPDMVREIVREHLEELSDKDIYVLLNDCEFQAQMELWGDPKLDKPGWVAWKNELEKEQQRRKENDGNNANDAV